MKTMEMENEEIVRETYEEGPGELSSRNPMVLSCGGIYIPNRKRVLDRPLWHVINLPDTDNPTKVVSSNIPKSPLNEILDKESLN